VTVRAGITLNEVEAVHGQEQARSLGVLQAQELTFDSAQRQAHQAAVVPDAVLGVDQGVAGGQLGEGFDRRTLGPGAAMAPLLARSEDLLLGDHGELLEREHEPLGQRCRPHLHPPPAGPAPRGSRLIGGPRLDPVLVEERAQAFRARQRRGRQHDAPTVEAPRLEHLHEGVQRPVAGAGLDQRAPQLAEVVGAYVEAFGVVPRVGDREALELHGSPRLDLLLDLLGGDQQVVGRRHDASARDRNIEALEGFRDVARQPRVPGLGIVGDDERVLGNEVQHRLEGGLQQGRQGLGPGWRVPAQQRVHHQIDRARLHVLRCRELADGFGTLDHEGAVDQQLAGRRGDGVTQRGLRALARRVELPDRLHLVAEQLDPQRVRPLRWEQVEDAASHGQLAALFDERHPRIARGDQRLDQRVAIDGLPHLEVDRARANRLTRGDAGGQSRPGCNDHRRGVRRGEGVRGRSSAGQPAVEDVHALGDHEGLGREALVGLGVMAGKGPDAAVRLRLAERRSQIVDEGVGRLGRRHQHQHRPIAVGADQVRGDHCARGTPQARQAHAARA
jgi:hypothetical protein